MAAISSSGATGEREKNQSPALLTPVRQPYNCAQRARRERAGCVGSGRWSALVNWGGRGACLRGRAAVVKLDGGLACNHDGPRVLAHVHLVDADGHDPVCACRRHAQSRASTCGVLAVQ